MTGGCCSGCCSFRCCCVVVPLLVVRCCSLLVVVRCVGSVEREEEVRGREAVLVRCPQLLVVRGPELSVFVVRRRGLLFVAAVVRQEAAAGCCCTVVSVGRVVSPRPCPEELSGALARRCCWFVAWLLGCVVLLLFSCCATLSRS